MIVKSHKLLVVTSSSCIAPSVLDSLSFAAVLFVTGGWAFKTIE
ncbi:hypothetical protein QWZ13_14330 [Reinekea marina]|nr:hypothetical protein [Reinekea marina]MDN3650093.1 hypothetical protein [Reinekea marina]